MKLVGTRLGGRLEEFYGAAGPTGPFSPDAQSAGRRALRNAALSLLVARGRPADRARLAAHYEQAGNMTDAAHALFLLAHEASPERDRALAHFYERWKGDHLVIDTWFAAQAHSPLPATLARVKALTQHPLFSLTAPNKVRALVGTFAAQNPVQFNRPDGKGYAFLASQVLALDRVNPQIAARMLGAFRNWRGLEPGRRALAKATLKGVAEEPGLSRDATEIVGRMLDM
jgi:aminopeptidase N